MASIQQDPSGYYYRVWNEYTCWGNDAPYIYNGMYRPTNRYMENNARLLFQQMYSYGWSRNSICAIIGNACRESFLNAGLTQIGYDIGGSTGGFGLLMWTPQTKFTDWARRNGVSVNSAYQQLEYLKTHPDEWIDKFEYNYMTFDEFLHDNDHSVEWLVDCFFDCYERGNPLKANMPYRRFCAGYYANEFFNYDPQDPVNPDPTPFRPFSRKLPLWMMLRKKRFN